MSAEISRDAWLAALGDVAAVCDPDAITLRELAAKYAIGYQAAGDRMRVLVQQGKAIKTWKMVGARRVPAYKLNAKAGRRR